MPTPSRLLITKNGALGDVIVSTAAIFELCALEEFQEIEICGAGFMTEILSPKLWPKVKTIWSIDKTYEYVTEFKANNSQWESTGQKIKYSELVGKFDAIANLRYESGRFIFPALMKGVKTRIGSAPWYFSFLYSARAPWVGIAPMMHERDRHLQIISAYPKLENSEKSWQGKGLPQLQEMREEVLQQWNLKNKSYILINPTCSERFKAWKFEKFFKLCQKLKATALEKNLEIIVVGAPNETAWLKEVGQNEFRIIQPQKISELIQLVAHARFLLTNASSMQYLATASATPTLALYGAALLEVWGPLGPRSKLIKGAHKAWSKDRRTDEVEAFDSILVEQVFAAITSQMEQMK